MTCRMWPDVQTAQLSYFLTVAEAGSFHRAAAALDIGQSAISRRIQKLEDTLGVSLFERRPSGARLTVAGECFALRVRLIMDEVNFAVDAARSAGVANNGHLQIGIIASLSAGPIRTLLQRFLDRHPQVEICLLETDRSELMTMLSHRRIDLVCVSGEPDYNDFDKLILAKEHVFLAVPSHHPLAMQPALAWSTLSDQRFVVSAREPGPEIHDYVIRRLSDLGRSVKVRRHRLGREGIMSLVGLGLGVSLVTDHWRGLTYPNVTFVPIRDEADHIPFSLVWSPENDNPALRRFISLARIEAKRDGALS